MQERGLSHEFDGIAPVGLHALAGFAGYQRGSAHSNLPPVHHSWFQRHKTGNLHQQSGANNF